MDPLTTSQPFTLNREDGTTLELPILTPSDRISFRNSFRTYRKTQLVFNSRLAGDSREELKKELNEFDARRLPERDVERWVNEPEGQREALALSIQRTKTFDGDEAVYAAVDALNLDPYEMHEAAAGVMGLKLVPVKEGEESKPDPTTAGTEPTGDAPVT